MATYLHEFLNICPKITNMSTQQENEKARFSGYFILFFGQSLCFIEPEKECRAEGGGGSGGGEDPCGLHDNKETQKSWCYTTAKQHYVGPVVTEHSVGTKSPQVKKNKNKPPDWTWTASTNQHWHQHQAASLLPHIRPPVPAIISCTVGFCKIEQGFFLSVLKWQ